MIDAGLLDLLDLNDNRKVYDFIRARYDYTDVPSEFNDVFNDQRVTDYLQRLNISRGTIVWNNGCPSLMKSMTIADVIKEIDAYNDLVKRSKASADARKASIRSGDYNGRFDHISKDIDPSEYTYAMKEHVSWCSKCVV